jgi:hypothetical protein
MRFLCVLLAFVLSTVWSLAEESKQSRQDAKWKESLSMEIPVVATAGALAVANLDLNRQGNVIIARAGEKIFCTLNFSCDSTALDPDALNQIVVGYAELGAQKCIFNELGFRCGEGIASFFLEAPKEPGIYEVQCRLDQAYSQAEALQRWGEEGGGAVTPKMTIGKIIVM